MRNCGTDALGSVVETVLNGVEENTYQYKPYGRLLAKSGVATDPSFLWNGGSGYRATALPSTEFYVRERHFSMTSCQWTSLEPTWPDQLPYCYVFGCPISQSDPSGRVCLAVDLHHGNVLTNSTAYSGFVWNHCPPL